MAPGRALQPDEARETMTSPSRDARASAFLDTGTLTDLLDGKGAAAHLFDADVAARAEYVVNPIVLQEILLSGGRRQRFGLGELVKDRITVLPIDPDKTERVLERARHLRDRLVHANDVLIFASASDCDYLVTDDPALAQLPENGRPEVLTAEQFLERMSA